MSLSLTRGENEEVKAVVGSNIKKCREERNMTKEEVAAKVGLTIPEYEKMESGTYEGLKVNVIARISSALHVSFGNLTEGTSNI